MKCSHKDAEHAATKHLTYATYLLVMVTAALAIVTTMLVQKTEHETHGCDIRTTEVMEGK